MQINLSRNELKALLTRTFEALYGHGRDYHDMAHTALWLESRGHVGVALLADILPAIDADEMLAPNLKELSPAHILMDGGGHNLFCLARSICDLTIALAAQHGTARLDVTNTDNNHVLMGVLTQAAQQDFAAIAIYQGYVAAIGPNETYPLIYQSENADSLSFICAKTPADLEDYMKDKGDIVTDAAVQEKSYKYSIESGIHIARSDYDALTHVANRVLVEATEASRKGAGE